MGNGGVGGGRARAIAARVPSDSPFSVGFTTMSARTVSTPRPASSAARSSAIGRWAALHSTPKSAHCSKQRGTVVLGAGARGSLG